MGSIRSLSSSNANGYTSSSYGSYGCIEIMSYVETFSGAGDEIDANWKECERTWRM